MKLGTLSKEKDDDGNDVIVIRPSLWGRLTGKPLIIWKEDFNEVAKDD